MITPTHGRIVWFHPMHDTILHYDSNPLAAMIAHVWNDRLVNLVVFDSMGVPCSRPSVQLLQDNDVSFGGSYCEWMPYQKGQATLQEKREANAIGNDLNRPQTS